MQELHFQKWVPESHVRASLLIVHGAGEHSGRYEHVINWFLQREIAVFAGDLPGLGRSPGKRGHIDRFSDYVTVVKEWARKAKADFPEVPLLVLGHSVGGLITIRLLEDPEVDGTGIAGAILSSPCLRLKMNVPEWKQKMAQFIGKIMPSLQIPNGIDPAIVSRSPEIVRKYAEDPYVEKLVSVRWFEELQSAMQQALLEAGKVSHPILLLQAGADRLVEPEAIHPFMERVPAYDKTMKVYPGLYHEILNEYEKQQVLDDILEWVNGHI